MALSTAATVDEYLAELPDDRRAAISTVRDLILHHLPAGYQEVMRWGMITYEIPRERYPNTYNEQPLCYAGLAAQKNYCSLYLMSADADSDRGRDLARSFQAAGKKLDMGKSCIRFRKPDDLALDAIVQVVAATPPDAFIAYYEASRKR